MKCAACSRDLDAHTCLTDDANPSPGDISVCWHCGHIAAYAGNMTLRELTAAEIHEVAGARIILAAQKARELLRNKK
jgi:hypothetical protein